MPGAWAVPVCAVRVPWVLRGDGVRPVSQVFVLRRVLVGGTSVRLAWPVVPGGAVEYAPSFFLLLRLRVWGCGKRGGCRVWAGSVPCPWFSGRPCVGVSGVARVGCGGALLGPGAIGSRICSLCCRASGGFPLGVWGVGVVV